MKTNWMLLPFILVFSVFGEENLRLPDIRALSLGNTGISNSVLINPALIEFSTDKVFNIEYFNRYSLKELGSINGCFQYPNSYLSTGLHIASFGFDQYRQNMIRLLAGKKLGEYWTIGIAFQYYWIQSELYESAPSRISTDIGIVYSPFDKLLIAFLLKDIPSVKVSNKELNIKELNSYQIQVGFNWKVINNLLITSFLGINEHNHVDGGFGLEYQAWNCFFMRVGAFLEPLLPTFGVGFNFNHWNFDISAIWHSTLGISSGVGLSYSF